MDESTLLTRLAVSLAIGLLVGLERGWRTRDEEDHQRVAGLRTFAISGLLGGVAGAVGEKLGGAVAGLIFIGYSAGFIAFHWLEARAEGNLSVTSVVAGMATVALGMLAVVGSLTAAIAGGVALTVLLALREQLHRWVASLTWSEIRAALTLLAMSFLLLPVLPNRTIDPWETINPHLIWLLAVMLASVSFGGYLAVRIFGDRLGVILAAVAGGLASSTATTLTLARLGRQHPSSSSLLAGGILAAGLVMVARVAVVATLLNPALLNLLRMPLLAAGAALAVGALFFLISGRNQSERPTLEISNPLELGSALKMALLIAAIMVISRLFQRQLGEAGVLLTAGISGVADVDAIVISMSRLALDTIEQTLATTAILLALAANTVTKAILSGYVGTVGIGLRVGIVSAFAIVVGIVASIYT